MKITFNPPYEFPTIFFRQYEVPNGSKPMDIHMKTPIEWLVIATGSKQRRHYYLVNLLLIGKAMQTVLF